MPHLQKNTKPTSENPIFWKNGKQYIRLYYFMPEKHLLNVIMNDEIKASIPAECNDPLEFMPAGDKKLPTHRMMGGFISFSSRYSSSLMWSHYADSHHGVCLCFDFPIKGSGKVNPTLTDFNAQFSHHEDSFPTRYAELDDNIINTDQLMGVHTYYGKKLSFFAEVNYHKERAPQSDVNLGGMVGAEGIKRLGISPAFFTKSDEWSYEKEWRLLVYLGQAARFDGHNFFIKGLTRHISEIILGARFPKDRYLMIEYILQAVKQRENPDELKDLHAQIRQADYHDKEYKIIIQ